VAESELDSALGPGDRRSRSLWALLAIWTIACVAVGAWWLNDRLRDHREQAAATAAVRLSGVKDTLAISLRQLGALPLDLAHRPSIPLFLADPQSAAGRAAQGEIQRMLDRLRVDFDLPLASLVTTDGVIAAISSRAANAGSGTSVRLDTRDYFIDALSRGAAIQFLFGRASRAPGLYFARRVERDGASVGVAVVKQDTETLNRLLNDADGARVFVTDNNGVVVLGNHNDMLLRRLPDAPQRPPELTRMLYLNEPAPLDWTQSREIDSGRPIVITRVGGARYATLSAALGEAPFKLWVLEPLDEEASIASTTWAVGTLLWLAGGLLIWMSWRRVQLLAATLTARREIVELAQALPLTVFRYTQTAQGTGRFAFLGRGVADVLGVEEAALERDPQLPWRLAGSGDTPPMQPQEFRVESANKTTWVLADSAVKHETDGTTVYNGYWLDITSRRETQARFAALFEYASTSYLFFDPRHGVTHCNPASLRMFGASDAQQLVGRILWFPGLSPEVQADGRPSGERALEDLRAHRSTGQRVRTFEWRFRRFDGSVFDAEVSVIALEWAGTPEFCAVLQDITARKQAEAEMRNAREAAIAASQTKSSFLANMSHELRTPMNAIIGMTHLALEDGLPDKQRDYIEKAHGSARNLLQILNDILDVSKIEAGHMALERVDFELESVIGDMADVLGLRADEKGLELLFTAGAEVPRRLVGDPTRLRQVLVNLGGNAIKFTERGEVTVGMEVQREDDDSVELHGWVRDTGSGMTADEIARLFQPFVQADSSTTRRHGGTGLGLVISRQLVERMGGRLWVDSSPGAGSTFHFTARFGRSVPRAPARAWMANELRGRRALLVDDNAAALEVLGNMLESLGIVVDRCSSGREALELVDAAPQAYTWFLIDWKMPGMDGIDCARGIIERHPLIQPCILLVTAFARDDALRASAGLPLAGVLHKPVTPSSLHDCLAQARRAAPASALASRRIVAPPGLPPSLRQRLVGARVLLVEDHPLNQQLACELLRRAGVDVTLAKDGREALERLDLAGPFDAVLMDCQMPVMDGYTATRELRRHERWARLPVIAMTASALAEDREQAMASGMNAHLTKPINVDTMLRTLADWIGGSPAAAAGAARTDAPLAAPPVASAIDLRAAAAICMNNDELLHRLLSSFRNTESSFIDEVRQALREHRPQDAQRRAHDMKGLAATLCAPRLLGAAQVLHAAIVAGRAEPDGPELEQIAVELDAVLADINTLVAAGRD